MRLRVFAAAAAACLALAAPAWAHFGMVIPETNITSRPQEVTAELRFWHPMENVGMELAKPAEAGVALKGKRTDLSGSLQQNKVDGHTTWRMAARLNRPGDYYFYMVPQPYWEPAEDCFIIHYTKAPVSALGMEEGWDEPVGLKMEIVPMTRPYGLYAGNAFTGQVLYKGKPLPGAEVEVEFFNPAGDKKAPAGAYVTQVVKADANGVFTWAMPWAGWWGFAALHTDDVKIKHEGQDKDVEVGGVIWVYAHE